MVLVIVILTSIVSTLEQAFRKVVASVRHLLLEVVVLAQVLQQLLGIARVLDLPSDLGVGKDLQDRVSGGLKLLEIFDDLLPLFGQLLRKFLIRIEVLVHLHGVVDHVCVGQEFELTPQQIGFIVDPFYRQEFHQRDDQVAVKKGAQLGRELPSRHFRQKNLTFWRTVLSFCRKRRKNNATFSSM